MANAVTAIPVEHHATIHEIDSAEATFDGPRPYTLLELVSGQTLEAEMPQLGGVIHASRDASGVWSTGRTGSDNSCGEDPVGVPMETTGR